MIKLKVNDIDLEVEAGITGFEIAEQISKSLSKEAIAFKANGKILDLSSFSSSV